MSFKRQICLDGDPTSDSLKRRRFIVPRVADSDVDQTKYLTFKINETERTFLIDSGAAISLLKRAVAEELNLSVSPSDDVLVDVSGNQLISNGVTEVELIAGSSNLIHHFVVCPDDLHLPADGLIGVDFLVKHKVAIDFAKNKFKFYNEVLSMSENSRNNDSESKTVNVISADDAAVDSEIVGSFNIFGTQDQNLSSVDHEIVDDRIRDQSCPDPVPPNLNLREKIEEYDKSETDFIMENNRPVSHNNIDTLKVDEAFILRLKTEIKIPARHTAVVELAVDKRMPDMTYVVEPRELDTPGILIARTLFRKEQDHPVFINIINVANDDVVIDNRTPIGLAITAEEQPEVEAKNIKGINTVNTATQHKFNLNHLPISERDKFQNFLNDYADVFKPKDAPLSKTTLVQHRIHTSTDAPIARAPYRVPFSRRQVMKDLIDDMLENEIIQPSVSPYSAPVVLVEKKLSNGESSFRFCIDYRELNKITKRDYFPLPNLQDTLDQLGKAVRFTTLDLTKGYWQVEMDPRDKEKTAFSVPWGHFECNRMPFGLINSPSTWQRLMYTVLAGLTVTHCFVYLDDIICFSSDDLDEHIGKLKLIFERLRDANLTLNPDKCKFMMTETKYLGHIVSKDGVKPDPEKISAIVEYPVPRDVTQIRSFLGLLNFYRRFIPNFAEIAQPLTNLTKKNSRFSWSEEADNAFKELRKLLTKSPILKFPNFEKPFILCTDASAYAIGAVLCQEYDGHEMPVAYASRQLKGAELNYSTTERECLALVWSIKHFRCYLYGYKFDVYTDHQPLKWLMKMAEPSNRLTKWSILLSEYDCEIHYRPGKKHTNADALSRIKPVRLMFHHKHYEPVIWDRDVMKSEQRNDIQIMTYIDKIHDEPSCDFYLDDDGLVYRKSDDERYEDRLVVPVKFRKQILKACHDSPLSGHCGTEKTFEKVNSRFFWPKLRSDVKDYVRKCVSCAQRKTSPHLKPAPLMKFKPAVRPFERIAMDVVGPLVTTDSGNKYILTVQDAATRYLEAFPMKDQSAITVAKTFIKGIILRHGTPRQLLTDLGTNFVSKLMKEICQILRIERLHTTAYRPQTNASLERSHRTLKDILSHYVNADHTDWDEWLPFAVSAFCSTVHSMVGETPFFLMYGRDVELPFDEIFRPLKTRYDTDTNYASEMIQRLKIAHTRAREQLDKNIDRVHRTFNKKSADVKFKVGDRVYLFTPAVKVGTSAKLAKKWTGPYRIIELREVNAVVKEIFGRKQMTVHVNRLKPCYSTFAENNTLPLLDSDDSPETVELYGQQGITPIIPWPERQKAVVDPSETVSSRHDETNPTLFSERSSEHRTLQTSAAANTTLFESTASTGTYSTVEEDTPPPPFRYATRSRGAVPDHPWILDKRIK